MHATNFSYRGTLTVFAAVILFLSLVSQVRAEEAPDKPAAEDAPTYTLHYKFKAGEVVRYDVEHRASIRTTIDEVTDEAHTQTESIKAWKIIDVLPEGDIEMMHVVERVHMRNRLPDRDEMEYDSDKDKEPPPGFEDAARSVGVPLSTIRLTPYGKILKRTAEHIHAGADPDAPIMVRLPEEAVAVGSTWDEPQAVSVELQGGGAKTVHTRRHFELKDVTSGVADVEMTYQVLSPITAHIEAQLVQRLMSGTIRFDIKKGRILSQQMDVDQRVLGFAGATSSMHYVMRLKETLLTDNPEVAYREKENKKEKKSQR